MNDFSHKSDMGLGTVRVDTTSNGGHPADYWVDNVISQLIYVSDTAPPVIRDQAHAYREAMWQAVRNGVHSAVLSHHTTLVHHLTKAGMHEAAALIRTIRS